MNVLIVYVCTLFQEINTVNLTKSVKIAVYGNNLLVCLEVDHNIVRTFKSLECDAMNLSSDWKLFETNGLKQIYLNTCINKK